MFHVRYRHLYTHTATIFRENLQFPMPAIFYNHTIWYMCIVVTRTVFSPLNTCYHHLTEASYFKLCLICSVGSAKHRSINMKLILKLRQGK